MAPLFFRHYATFFETFWIAPKGPPSFVSTFWNTMDVKKIPKGPPFTFFGTVTLFKNLIFKILLGNFFKVPKGLPFNFFHILQPAGVSQSPKGPPFTILSLRYSADFGRSRLLFFFVRQQNVCVVDTFSTELLNYWTGKRKRI